MCERERENRGRRVSPRPKPTTTPKCQDQVRVVISVFLRFPHDHALMAVFPLRLSGVSTEVTTLPYECRALDSARCPRGFLAFSFACRGVLRPPPSDKWYHHAVQPGLAPGRTEACLRPRRPGETDVLVAACAQLRLAATPS